MKPSPLQLSSLLLLALSSTSCAAMFDGTKSEVHFTSEPSGLEVRAGEAVGTTPVTLTIKKSVKTATISQKDGAQREIPLKRTFQGGYFLMDFLFTPGFGLSGMLVDGASSAWYKHESFVHCDLTKPAPVEAVPAAAPKPTHGASLD